MKLCQSVLSAFPLYTMQSTQIPKGVCEEVEKAYKKFILSDSNFSRKVHLVRWKLVCQPKAHRGLGIRKMAFNNAAILMKLA